MITDTIKELLNFGHNKQLIFAYLTCERLYPNYIHFLNIYDFGNPNILRDAIDFCYDCIFDQKADKDRIKKYLIEIDKHTPRPENFDTIFASSALDACTATMETLNFIMDKQSSHINDISIMAIETIHMYIQDRDQLDFNTDKFFESKIANDPLMQNELNIQKGIISYLKNSEQILPSDIETLLGLQNNDRNIRTY